MSNVKCPHCGTSDQVHMTSPDYGYPQHGGASFRCYRCSPYGCPFSSRSAEALAESDASRAASRHYAATWNGGKR